MNFSKGNSQNFKLPVFFVFNHCETTKFRKTTIDPFRVICVVIDRWRHFWWHPMTSSRALYAKLTSHDVIIWGWIIIWVGQNICLHDMLRPFEGLVIWSTWQCFWTNDYPFPPRNLQVWRHYDVIEFLYLLDHYHR